jgi:hypothetical protein
MEVEDGSESGSERSATPELIIPDDFGASSDDDEAGEGEGEAMQT